ncbi:MAG: peptide-methionine (S)-S-oxide reductase, partial [Rhodocyclaceae bacterium]|nr:peptide-methionine (S)-S-oxide reductase [Rhodocyclaceae bacterium]
MKHSPRTSPLAVTLAVVLAGFNAPSLAAADAVATFSGGCFWSLEAAFDKLPGVRETTNGYT